MNLFDLSFNSSKNFFSHDCEKAQYPIYMESDEVNGINRDENYLDSSYLNTCLYRTCNIDKMMKAKSSKPDAGKMNFNLGIERVIAHLLVPELYPDLKGYGGYGFDEEGNFFADYWDNTADVFNQKFDDGITNFGDGNHQIFKITPKMQVLSYIVDDSGHKKKLVLDCKANAMNKTEKHSSSGVLYALIAYLFEKNKQAKATGVTMEGGEIVDLMYRHFCDCKDNAGVTGNPTTYHTAARCLDNDIYTLFNYSGEVKKFYSSLPLNVVSIDRTEYPILKDEDIKLDSMVGDSVYLSGERVVSSAGGFINQDDIPNEKTLAEILKDSKYVLDETRELSNEEILLVPTKYDSFVPHRKVLTIAEDIKESSVFDTPDRNIFISGSTGSGKSTSCQMLARLLNLPYTFLTIQPDTLLSDLYVNILPATETDKESVEALTSTLPTATEIALDPITAYKRITGKTKEEVSEEDCSKAIRDKYYELFNKSNGFIKVESPLVQAFRYGWCLEIQEANTANKPGVLAGINAALDSLATIQLPTGEVVKRHPDTVVVLTANIGYAGRRQMDESVIGRMHIVEEFELPEDKQLIQDLMNVTGYTDEDTIQKMIDCMKMFKQTLEDNGYSDACCGRRELESWIKKTVIFKDPYRAAFTSFINKLELIAQNASGGIDKDLKPLLIANLELKFHKTGMPDSTILSY